MPEDMEIEDGIVLPPGFSIPVEEDDDSDFDGDFFTPKGDPINETFNDEIGV